jgi:cytochrome b pre-mRNA-processing protein 3
MATSFLARLLGPGPAKAAGTKLYSACVAQARRPELYAAMGAPDTVEGRFELYSMHVSLLLVRLKGQGRDAGAVSQALFDVYVSDLDNALRELGVGDLSVAKTMRKLGSAFYGRLKGYEGALAALPQTAELQALLARTVFEDLEEADAGPLCAYAAAAFQALQGQDLAKLVAGEAAWPAP